MMNYKPHKIKSIRKENYPTSYRNNSVSSSIITNAKKKKEDVEYIKKINDKTRMILNQITNINDLDNKANSFIAKNINSVGKFKDNLINAVSRIKNEIRENQNNNIKYLKEKIKEYQNNYEGYHNLAKRNRSKGLDDSRYKSKYKAQRTKITETEKIIKRLQNGERLNKSKIIKYINNAGKYRERKVTYQIKKKNMLNKQKLTNEYINKISISTRPRSLLEIKKQLELSEKDAKKVQNIINKNINERIKTTDKIKENVLNGVKYSDDVLINAGLTKEEIKEIKDVEKLNNKRKKSLLDKFNNTKIDIKKYGDKIINAKSTKDIIHLLNTASTITRNKELFEKLNNSDKQLITNYQAIKTYRDKLKEIKDINKLANIHKELSGMKRYATQLKNTKTTKEAIRLLNSISLITSKDKSNFAYLKRLSNKQIQDLVLKNNSKLFKSLVSANKILLAEETNYKAKLENLEGKLRIELDKIKQTENILRKMPNSPNLKAGKQISLIAIKEYVGSLKNKNKKITDSEYNNILNSMSDLLGTKQVFKKIKYEANKKRTPLGQIKVYLDVLNTLWDISKDTVSKTKKTILFFSKILYDLGKWGLRSYKDLKRELGFALKQKINKLSEKQKKQLFKETKANFRFIKTTKDALTFAIKNPEVVYSGALILGGLGLLNLRKTIIKNPKSIVSEILSWYVIEELGNLGITGAIMLKASFSPFVMRNVKVYSKSPTIRKTAQAIRNMEGKQINLYSATPEDVKKLFKGINLSKKAERLLINDMLKNPTKYISSNLKIRPLEYIAKTKPQKEMINFLKYYKKGIITGSSSLKLQLKKFRNIGDFDIIAKDSEKFAKDLVEYLNEKTLWGELWKTKRYSTRRLNRIDGVWKIYDRKKPIADIDSFKLVNEDFLNRVGRKLSNKDILTINGVKVLKVEPQLVKKIKIARDSTKAYREIKEMGDVKLILSKIKKSLRKKDYKKTLKLLNEEKGVLRVKGNIRNMGLDRQYGWAKKFLPDLNLRFGYNRKTESIIRSRLKKIGFTDTKIDDYIRRYSPDHFYFSPDVVYQHFLFKKGKIPKKASVIFSNKITINNKYPKKIKTLLGLNKKGLLSESKKGELRQLLNEYIKKNPNMPFVSEKALIDNFGENEILVSIYSRLYPKKTLFKREIYFPELERFIKAQEVTIGFKDTSLLKKSIDFFKGKIKGKTIKQLTNELKEWLKQTKKTNKSILKNKKTDFIKKQQELIDDEINQIQKLKLPKERKDALIKDLRATRRNINKLGRNTNKIRTTVRTALTISRKRITIRRTRPKTTSRNRIITRPKTISRKRITIRRTRPKTISRNRITTRNRKTQRIPKRLISTRATQRIPKRLIKPIKKTIKTRPKIINLKFNKNKIKQRTETKAYNVQVRIRGKTKTIRLMTTKNRAIKKIAHLIDNTTARSFQLIEAGTTTLKEIKKPKIINKFRLRKSKNSKVLKLVEKTKYSIDTKGEKRGLSIAKALSNNKINKNRKYKKTIKRKSTKKKQGRQYGKK